jgi:hypothetical protein
VSGSVPLAIPELATVPVTAPVKSRTPLAEPEILTVPVADPVKSIVPLAVPVIPPTPPDGAGIKSSANQPSGSALLSNHALGSSVALNAPFRAMGHSSGGGSGEGSFCGSGGGGGCQSPSR